MLYNVLVTRSPGKIFTDAISVVCVFEAEGYIYLSSSNLNLLFFRIFDFRGEVQIVDYTSIISRVIIISNIPITLFDQLERTF